MIRLLIVEDEPKDLRMAADVARSLDITAVQARTSAKAAKLCLEEALEGGEPLPHLVVLDLDLGYDSGFELLRFWHSDPRLSKVVHMVVWTALGEEQQEICRLFKVDAVVPKGDGMTGLRQVVERLTAQVS